MDWYSIIMRRFYKNQIIRPIQRSLGRAIAKMPLDQNHRVE
jgi:hypothetical protein